MGIQILLFFARSAGPGGDDGEETYYSGKIL
jgi:hypothetical protein